MKKFNCSKILVISISVLLLVMGSVFLVMAEEKNTVYNANGIEVGYSKKFTAAQVSALRNVDGVTGAHSTPETEYGYIFAGWYSDPACKSNSVLTNDAINTMLADEDSEDATFYAKFVSGEILNVKGQLQSGTDSTSKQAILRFVTTVDALDYLEVGFSLELEGKTYTVSTEKVYQRLYAVGTSEEESPLLPTEFHDGSRYFMAVNLNKIPADSFGSEATAVPYWITCDGTKVENTNVETKSVVQGMPTVCEALVTNASGEKQGYYSTLEKALKVNDDKSANLYLNDGDTVTVIQDNVEITEQLYVYNRVTLTNETERDVTITRVENMSPASFLYYTSTLTVAGTTSEEDSKGSLTFDGENHNQTQAGLRTDSSTSELSLDNVTIKNIVTTQTGGAIRSYGKATITGCTFENNILNINGTTATNGGAIYHRGNGTLSVDDCNFTSNKATSGDGGAIYVYQGTAEISGSRFESNSSAGTSGGGAIFVRVGTTTISDTDFVSNSATSGGAVYNYKATGMTINETCEFSENSAANGGALYVYQGTTEISNSKFTSNASTEANGGAIYFGEDIENLKELTLTGCTFDSNNTVSTGYGGAVYMNCGTATVSGSTFEQNGTTGADLGGAIYVNDGTTTISGSKFSSNQATSKGGGVYDNQGTVTIQETCTFSENSAAEGGALYEYNGATEISDSSFTSNVSNSGTSNAGGGAIYYRGATSAKLKLTRCIFTSNEATGNTGARAGAVYIYRGGAEITGSTFTSNGWNVTTEEVTTVNGGAIYVREGDTDILDTDFEGNKATASGGAVYINTNKAIVDITDGCTFSENGATSSGGAIYNLTGTLTVDGSTLSSNGLETTPYGGAIYISAGTTTVSDTDFNTNKVATDGGAIYNLKGALIVNNGCTFTSNTANNSNGGAIYVSDSTATLDVSASTFTSNRAYITTDVTTAGGGAIYVDAAKGEISNSDFDQNIGRRGGAIHVNAGSVTIENGCMFSDNTARRGGAVYFYSTGTGSVRDCIFIGNGTITTGSEVITAYGGAFQCYKTMTIDGCVFDKNVATNASAGYSQTDTFNITNTTLIDQAEADFNTAKITLLTQANESATTNSVDNIHDADDGHQLSLLTNIDEAGFEAYCDRIESMGFELRSENEMSSSEDNENIARTYYSTETGYMLHTYWVEYSQEVRTQVAEMDESMLEPLVALEKEESTTETEAVCPPLFHQLKALSYSEEYTWWEGGMGYIIRLTDGRFVIIDGGSISDNDTTGDPDNMWNDAYEIAKFLVENNVRTDGKIVIASWIFTHAHSDHVGAFKNFVKHTGAYSKYHFTNLRTKGVIPAEDDIHDYEVELQSIMFNACDTDEQMLYSTSETSDLFTNYIQSTGTRTDGNGYTYSYPEYFKNTKIYKPLTGQKYRFADTSIEILHTMSDFLPQTIGQSLDGNGGDYNIQSVVSIVDVDCNNDKSDRFFIMGDTTKVACDEMSNRYGTYMECDYVQVAHHGYNEIASWTEAQNSRRHGATQEIYEFILKDDDSTIVMWPTSESRFAAKTADMSSATQYIPINYWLVTEGQEDRSKHWVAESVSDDKRTIKFD